VPLYNPFTRLVGSVKMGEGAVYRGRVDVGGAAVTLRGDGVEIFRVPFAKSSRCVRIQCSYSTSVSIKRNRSQFFTFQPLDLRMHVSVAEHMYFHCHFYGSFLAQHESCLFEKDKALLEVLRPCHSGESR
jgi:hypothetical protein